jgi:glycosyltransferase involved in cell wall biosynthesis
MWNYLKHAWRPQFNVVAVMTVLFGHPTGNANAHHAALAHFEAGRLEAFCVPWMPSGLALHLMEQLGVLEPTARRLARRHFAPLRDAPKVQGRIGEMRRLLTRALGGNHTRLSYEANDWLMRTMSYECRRSAVTAVHAYEDCSAWQFAEGKRLGKACIYDMPIGYYPAWEQTQLELARRYRDWLPTGGLPSQRYVRPEQKRLEMQLADLVIVPSNFAANTVREFHADMHVALAPYGIDTAMWRRNTERRPDDVITFIFAGQCSLRKGIPLLLDAWRAAGLKHAKLRLVGSWQLAEIKRKTLPPQVGWTGHVSSHQLLTYYEKADVFVFPTYFEGRALVVGEALSSGLPVLTTPASGWQDVIDTGCGRTTPIGNLDGLVESLRWFEKHREQLPAMSRAAREQAVRTTWENYRRCVTQAVASFV